MYINLSFNNESSVFSTKDRELNLIGELFLGR